MGGNEKHMASSRNEREKKRGGGAPRENEEAERGENPDAEQPLERSKRARAKDAGPEKSLSGARTRLKRECVNHLPSGQGSKETKRGGKPTPAESGEGGMRQRTTGERVGKARPPAEKGNKTSEKKRPEGMHAVKNRKMRRNQRTRAEA